MAIEDWELTQLGRKFPEATITRDEGQWFTARHPGSDTTWRDRSASLTEAWLAHVQAQWQAEQATSASVEDFTRRLLRDADQVQQASPQPWRNR